MLYLIIVFGGNYIPITKIGFTPLNLKTVDIKNTLSADLDVMEPNSTPEEKIDGLLQVMDKNNKEFCGDAAYTDKFMIFNLLNSQDFQYDEFEFICIERSKYTANDLWRYFSTESSALLQDNRWLSRAGDASVRLLDGCRVNECLKSTKQINNTWLQIFKITGTVSPKLECNKNKHVIIHYFSCCNYTNFQSINIPITVQQVQNFTQVYDDLQEILDNLTSEDLNLSLTFLDPKLVPNK